MKPSFFGVALWFVILAQHTSFAGETNFPPLRLELDLADGSRVIGIPTISSVPVQTAYAKMNILLDQILNMAIEADHETTTFQLANGDNVKGVINLSPVRLETVFGKVTVGTEFIMNVRVRRSGTETLPGGLKDSLFLHYSFAKDDGDKVVDQSGNENHGIVCGAQWMPNGFDGGAYMFDGNDDYIQVTSNVYLDATYAMWFKKATPNTGGNNSDSMGLFGFAATTKRIGALIDRSSGYPNTIIALIHQDDMNGLSVRADVAIADTKWHHMVVVRKASGMKLYLDGGDHTVPHEQVGTVVSPIGVGSSMSFGSYHPYSRLKFHGCMDEIQVFNRALSADEIQALFRGMAQHQAK